MFTFAWPSMILLVFLPFIVRYLLPPARRGGDQAAVRFAYMNRIMSAFSDVTLKASISSYFLLSLLSLLWLSLVVALMQPQIINKIEDIPSESYDIILAVDLSGSMRAMDFQKGWLPVSRFDIAREVVGDFVKGRKEDRIGLVLFGSFAYQYAPLTMDHKAVVKMLNDTVISMAGDGTAIGDAIGLSVKALRDRPEKSRIIILLTDGEDTASSIPPLQAAKLAKQYGIKIYTIGIGRDGMIPYGFGMARTVSDGKLLRSIAQQTGGSFFAASDTDALIKVYEQIDRLEKTKAESRTYVTRTPLYRYPLGFAFFLLFLMAVTPLFVSNIPRERGGRYA